MSSTSGLVVEIPAQAVEPAKHGESSLSSSSLSSVGSHERRQRRLSRLSRPAPSASSSTMPTVPSTATAAASSASASASSAQEGLQWKESQPIQTPNGLISEGARTQSSSDSHMGTRRKAPSFSFLSLPLLAAADVDPASSDGRTSSDSKAKSRAEQLLLGPGANISRSHSLRVESTRSMPSADGAPQADTRGDAMASSSTAVRLPMQSPEKLDRAIDVGHGSPSSTGARVRRWSSLSRTGPATSALRIAAEGASPYLRAGLDELRSIFDVESDPIPASPSGGSVVTDDDFEDAQSQEGAQHSPLKSRGRLAPSNGPPLAASWRAPDSRADKRDTSIHIYEQQRGQSEARGRRDSIVKSVSERLRRTSFRIEERNSLLPTAAHPMGSPSSPMRSLARNESAGSPRLRSADSSIRMPLSFPSSPSQSPSCQERSTREEGRFSAQSLSRRSSEGEKQQQQPQQRQQDRPRSRRGGRDTRLYLPTDLRKPMFGRSMSREVAVWGLAAIAASLVALSAWGYAYHSDTFSPTLIGFFLTQPAFALLGLASLIARSRAAMDLSSRAMRAHVLAQVLIVLFAYFDLSSSSFYARSRSDRPSRPFRLMPSMEMRFGPTHDPIDAGLAPGASLLMSAQLGEAQIHAHDTEVGNLSSRLTHLIVFLVQAAAPILLALYVQYSVAHALGVLARSSSLSRRTSSTSTSTAAATRQLDEKSKHSTHALPMPRLSHSYHTLPTLDAGELASRLRSIEAVDDFDQGSFQWDNLTSSRSTRDKRIRLSMYGHPPKVREQTGSVAGSSSRNGTTTLSPVAVSALVKKKLPSPTFHAHTRSLSQPTLLPTQEAASEALLLFTESPLAKTPPSDDNSSPRATSPDFSSSTGSGPSQGSAGVPVSMAGTEHWSAAQMAVMEKGVRTGIQSPRRSASNVDQ